MFPIKMRLKKTGNAIDVYGFVNDKAVCFDLGKYKAQNQGMVLVDLKTLVPYDAYIKKENHIGLRSAKARVKLKSAIWVCTDGSEFNCHEDAIQYEEKIMLENFEVNPKEEE